MAHQRGYDDGYGHQGDGYYQDDQAYYDQQGYGHDG
jgi:1,3-beta-glucan synthase